MPPRRILSAPVTSKEVEKEPDEAEAIRRKHLREKRQPVMEGAFVAEKGISGK
jgi:hypothetical protein